MGGFDSENIRTISSMYICRICTLILRDPVQLDCGHRFCETCMDVQTKELIQCLQCKVVVSKYTMFSDRGMKNDMGTLSICCSICPWNGLFKNYQNHWTKNHLNTSTGQSSESDVAFQIRKLVESTKELLKNVRILKSTTEQILSQSAVYQTSIEEQNPPGEVFHQQQQDSFTSYDGTLLWKIDRIKSRLNETSGSVLTSTPFYTSSNGYKMCVRLYLNGHGQSTHISIFLILMPGDFDPLLDWPFNFQVIFCLCDVIKQENHILESFQSNTKSKSFQRPQSELNIGSGISKFIPKAIIQQDNSSYVCDDSIYIKVMVTKDCISSLILPTIMNINPAWPIYMQQEIIQKEIKKHEMRRFKLNLTLKSQ